MVREDLTVVLTNYKRPSNMMQIMAALAGKCTIFVWDNSHDSGFDDLRADWVVRSSDNVYCCGRYWMMQHADTSFVAGLDDDLLPTPGMPGVVCKLLEHLDGAMIGVAGVRMLPGKSYRDSDHVGMGKGPMPRGNERVDLLKGRFMAVPSYRMRRVRWLPMREDQYCTENDLRVSAEMSGGFVSEALCACFLELPTGKEALHRRPNHWVGRDAVAHQTIGQNLQDRSCGPSD